MKHFFKWATSVPVALVALGVAVMVIASWMLAEGSIKTAVALAFLAGSTLASWATTAHLNLTKARVEALRAINTNLLRELNKVKRAVRSLELEMARRDLATPNTPDDGDEPVSEAARAL